MTIRTPEWQKLRIGFLNPWQNAAENHAFCSLKIAGQRIGYDIIHVCNSDQIEAAKLDFVLASASTQPKLTDIPTFGIVHEPRRRFLENERYFHNLLSY